MTDSLTIYISKTSLSHTANVLAQASLAPNTLKAYQKALAALYATLGERPLSDLSLANYLAARYDEGLSAATLCMCVAAVRYLYKLSGLQSPVGAETLRVLGGAKRTGAGRGRGQVEGVRWHEADAAVTLAVKGGTVLDLRDAALLSVASDALLRVSELATLRVSDLTTETDGSGRLRLGKSKTDQTGEGVILYLGKRTCDRVRIWLQVGGIDGGYLFRRVRRGGCVQREGLTCRSVRTIIKRRCVDAGLEGRVSGHSLRVGSAQSLVQAGAGLVELQLAGRWKSPCMPAHYAQGALAAQGAVARLRYKAS